MLKTFVWMTASGALLAAAVLAAALGAVRLIAGGRWWERFRLAPAAPGAVVAFVLGAAVFAPSIALLQVPLQNAVSRWVMASLATAEQAVLLLPVVLPSGLVQEPAKLAAALVAVSAAVRLLGRAGRRSPGGDLGRILGVAAGAGFGWYEASHLLSRTLEAAAGMGLGVMVLPTLERFSAVLIHMSLTGLVTGAWGARGRGAWPVLVAVALVHGLVNYTAVVLLPLAGAPLVEAGLLVTALGLTALLARGDWRGGRGSGREQRERTMRSRDHEGGESR